MGLLSLAGERAQKALGDIDRPDVSVSVGMGIPRGVKFSCEKT